MRSLSTGGGAKRCLGEEKREGTGARAIRRRRRRENRRPAPTTNKRFCVCSLSLFLSLFRTHRRRGARGSHAHVDGGAHVVDSSSLDRKRLRRSREKGRKGERRVFFLFVVDFFCGSKSEEKKTKLRTFRFFLTALSLSSRALSPFLSLCPSASLPFPQHGLHPPGRPAPPRRWVRRRPLDNTPHGAATFVAGPAASGIVFVESDQGCQPVLHRHFLVLFRVECSRDRCSRACNIVTSFHHR